MYPFKEYPCSLFHYSMMATAPSARKMKMRAVAFSS